MNRRKAIKASVVGAAAVATIPDGRPQFTMRDLERALIAAFGHEKVSPRFWVLAFVGEDHGDSNLRYVDPYVSEIRAWADEREMTRPVIVGLREGDFGGEPCVRVFVGEGVA